MQVADPGAVSEQSIIEKNCRFVTAPDFTAATRHRVAHKVLKCQSEIHIQRCSRSRRYDTFSITIIKSFTEKMAQSAT